MIRYLISFDDGWMTFPAEDLEDVSAASHRVVQDAKDAGVWIFGAGIDGRAAHLVGTDGLITPGLTPADKPVIGGFSIIEVESHADALEWAAKMAVACRCPQEVRELMFDPES